VAEPRLKLTNVSKHFRLPHEKHSSLKAAVLNWHKRSYEQLAVLKSINLEVKDGEFFGIIGRNGSGKSTLLKILAGIYQPSSGGVTVNGKLTPFIELGVGFNSELTGRDNVFLNGAILGLTRNQIEEKYKEIVAFAELEKFMDQKLKNYSSGMQVRLAFSVAIQAHSDILLIDEVLAVGDLNFQQKCYDYFRTVKKQKKTVILVTHDMNVIQEYCDNATVLDSGEIAYSGSTINAVNLYNEIMVGGRAKKAKKNRSEDMSRQGTGAARYIQAATMLNGKTQNVFKPLDKIELNLDLVANESITEPTLGFEIRNQKDETVFGSNTQAYQLKVNNINKGTRLTLSCKVDNIFANGKYKVSAAIKNKARIITYDQVDNLTSFEVIGWPIVKTAVHPKYSLELIKIT
jgi:ABC-2 type transport system ATP-binding protein